MLEVTVGCTHNRCKFCSFYKNTPFRVAPMSQIEEDLQEIARRYPNAKDIYALGGDPFSMSFHRLKEIGSLIKQYLPEVRISTYARVTSITQKSIEELKELRSIGWDDLTIGIESGDDEALSLMNKGYTSADILRECKKLEEAGINYYFIYLGGLTGRGHCERNALNTAAVVNQLHPCCMYLSSVAVIPGTELDNMVKKGEFTEATELERIKEVLCLVKSLKNPITLNAQSEANAVNFVARLPEDREVLIREFERIIASFSSTDERNLRLYRESMSGM